MIVHAPHRKAPKTDADFSSPHTSKVTGLSATPVVCLLCAVLKVVMCDLHDA